MNYLNSKPINDGFYMPAEFSKHQATILIWPTRPGSWGKNPTDAQNAFCNVINTISENEVVYLLTLKEHNEQVKNIFNDNKNVIVLQIDTNDAWTRDTAPTFVTNDKEVRGISWNFNAWGGDFDGLYSDWEKDNALAKKLCDALNCKCYNAEHFVLEGGSIHSDGEGTLLVTESCLLSKGRNPELTKTEIENVLKEYLSIKKVLWLPRGIYNDETNEHVDNVCSFIAPAEVVLAWTDNKNDPQYELSKACLDYLENITDAQGRKIKVHKLPIPDNPICCSEDDCNAYEFEEGEDVRNVGDRLAASYVNFYFCNNTILLPQFGGENIESDKRAIDIMSRLCPNHKVVGIDSRAILQGGGNIHCITQQIPKGDF